jgi:hypothetical protein
LRPAKERPEFRWRRPALSAALAALFAVAVLYARHFQAMAFAAYDDEGCMLISLRDYLAGGHLYRDVFSYYGPLHFLLQAAFFRGLGLPVTHDAGRLVTLLCWLLQATLGGWFVYRVSRQVWLAAGAFLGCTLLLSFLGPEPGHPQQWILVFLTAAACAAAQEGGAAASLALLGALGAALLFLKINVGVFYCAALAQALAAALAPGRWRNAATALALAAAVLLPAAVTLRSRAPGGMRYGLLAALAEVAVFLAARRFSPLQLALRGTAAAAAGAAAAGLVILAAAAATGTSPAAVADGVLWIPLHQASPFSLPLWVGWSNLALAAAGLAAVAALWLPGDRWRRHGDWIDAARLAVGAWAAWGLLAEERTTLVRLVALLPLGLVPRRGGAWRPGEFWPRMFLALLAAGEFLQAYPVAGGQASVAAMPVLLWAMLCIGDGWEGAVSLLGRSAGMALRPWLAGAAVTACYLAAAIPAHGSFWTYPDAGSRLPGSAGLHLPANVEAGFERLTADLRANCDLLTSLPGTASLNLWSGVPAPNGWNLTNWMQVFTPEQQRRIVARLESSRRSCAVVNHSLLDFWETPRDSLQDAPLANYILLRLRKAEEENGYEIRIRPDRDFAWSPAGR